MRKKMCSTDIVKILSKIFLFHFVEKSFEFEILKKYIPETTNSVFDLKGFSKEPETFGLIPKNLTSGEIEKILKIYKERPKESLSRIILEENYDKKFKTEFNKKADSFLKEPENYFIETFFKIIENSYRFFSYNPDATNDYWDFSGITSRTYISGRNLENKLDNIYNAYIVWAQAEYSKLLIGLLNDFKTTKPIKDIISNCINVICNDETIKKHISKISYSEEDKKNFLNKKKLSENAFNINKEIYANQMLRINYLLQKYNDFKPYDLDTKYGKNNNKDKERTLREAIISECDTIAYNFKKYNLYKKDDIYSPSAILSKSQSNFITEFFNKVFDLYTIDEIVKMLPEGNKHKDMNLEQISLKDKVNVIRTVNQKRGYQFIDDRRKKTWAGILQTLDIKGSKSYDAPLSREDDNQEKLLDIIADEKEYKEYGCLKTKAAKELYLLFATNFENDKGFLITLYANLCIIEEETLINVSPKECQIWLTKTLKMLFPGVSFKELDLHGNVEILDLLPKGYESKGTVVGLTYFLVAYRIGNPDSKAYTWKNFFETYLDYSSYSENYKTLPESNMKYLRKEFQDKIEMIFDEFISMEKAG